VLAPGTRHCWGLSPASLYHSKTAEITKDAHLYRAGCIRGLYVELAELRRMKVELQGETGIDVEAYFAATLSEWIDALNTEAPQYAVEPLLLPQ
jgi:hypothetical protein